MKSHTSLKSDYITVVADIAILDKFKDMRTLIFKSQISSLFWSDSVMYLLSSRTFMGLSLNAVSVSPCLIHSVVTAADTFVY